MNTTPRIARFTAKLTAGFVAAGLLAAGAAAVAPAPEAAAATMSAAQKESIERKVEAQLVTLTNNTRKRVGLKALKVDYTLTKSTRAWSTVMSGKNKMFHSTTYPFPRYTESAGENVLRAPANATAAQMQKAWEASPTHWANLAAKRYGYVGFGAEIDNRGNIWVTAHFLGDVNGDYKPASAPKAKSTKAKPAAVKVASKKVSTARTTFTKQVSKQKKAVSTAKSVVKQLNKKAKKSVKVRKAVSAVKSYQAFVAKKTPKVTSKSSLSTITKNTKTVKNRTAKLNALIKAAKRA